MIASQGSSCVIYLQSTRLLKTLFNLRFVRTTPPEYITVIVSILQTLTVNTHAFAFVKFKYDLPLRLPVMAIYSNPSEGDFYSVDVVASYVR